MGQIVRLSKVLTVGLLCVAVVRLVLVPTIHLAYEDISRQTASRHEKEQHADFHPSLIDPEVYLVESSRCD